MPKPVEVNPLAVREAGAAFRWYARQSESAAAGFALELKEWFEALSERPASFPEYLLNTRRVLFRRYPYIMVSREQADRVEVVAVAHGSRRPGYWARRLKP